MFLERRTGTGSSCLQGHVAFVKLLTIQNGVERVGIPYDWREPNGLPTLHIGDATQEQVVFLAYGVPDGECDNSVCAL